MADHEIRLLQDRVLADSARHGGRGAFEELYRRHAGAAWRYGHALVPRSDLVGPAVVRAFGATLADPTRGGVPAGGMRGPILASTRHAALAVAGATDPGGPWSLPEGTPADAALPLQVFRSLPERWRSALWLVEVEHLSPAEAAQVLDVPAATADPMVARAWQGLRDQVLRAGLRDTAPIECRRTAERLTAYAAGSLAERDEVRVRGHLDECLDCRDRLTELDDLAVRLRGATPALPAALAQDARRHWEASLVRPAGPLGLNRRNGTPVPVWVERAVAGGVAAIITLGVTGALIAGGRNRSRDDNLVRDAGTSLGLGDGESALGGGDGLSGLPDGGVVVPAAPAPTAPSAAAPGLPLPRRDAPATPAADVASPRTSSTWISPPSDPGGPNGQESPPEPGASSQITIGVAGAVSIAIGECNGISVLGTVLGCEPAPSDAPVTVATSSATLPGALGL